MTVSAKVHSILQQISALSADEYEQLRAQLEHPPINGTHTNQQDALNDQAAFTWINEHGGEYQGEWLALDGDRLLAHGPHLNEVAAAARKQGIQFPLLHLVEPSREHPYIRS